MRIVSAYVTDEQAAHIESLAVRLNRSRSWVLRAIVQFSMDNAITFLNNQRSDIQARDNGGDGGDAIGG